MTRNEYEADLRDMTREEVVSAMAHTSNTIAEEESWLEALTTHLKQMDTA